jgi:hypothetical protein
MSHSVANQNKQYGPGLISSLVVSSLVYPFRRTQVFYQTQLGIPGAEALPKNCKGGFYYTGFSYAAMYSAISYLTAFPSMNFFKIRQ